MPERLTSWLNNNWPWLTTLVSVLGIGVRNEITTQRLQKTVYNEDGGLRLVRISDCDSNMRSCPTRDQITGLREWLIRVEGKLDQAIMDKTK